MNRTVCFQQVALARFNLSLKSALVLSISLALSLGLGGQAIAQLPAANAEAATSSAQAQRMLFVHPTLGNDRGTGTEQSPYRTITHALRQAIPGMVVQLAAGTYSAETGEEFPIVLPAEVTLQGDPRNWGQGVVIRGGGSYLSPTFARQNIALLSAANGTLMGVTVTNPNPRGYGLWIESSSPIVAFNTFMGSTHDGISTTGTSAPAIRGNLFYRNGANGLSLFGQSRPEIRGNAFEQTGFGIVVANESAPRILDNRIRRNRDGVVVQQSTRPILRGNLIEANDRDGVVAIADSQPDLGTTGNPGNNIFRDNGRSDLNTSDTTQPVPAFGNEFDAAKLLGEVDTTGATLVSAPVDATPDRATLLALLPNWATQTARLQSATTPISAQAAPLTNGAAIEIAVPPPETNSPQEEVKSDAIEISVSPASRSSPSPALLAQNLLPVPGANVPLGNTGDLPRIPVSAEWNGSNTTVYSGNPVPSNLRYRVVVDASSDRARTAVQSLAPGAFLTRIAGREVMQVGAFSDRANAEEVVQILNSNGLRAVIQPMQ